MLRNVLIIGATSAIAFEAAREFARTGANLVITGRDQGRLDSIRADLVAHKAHRVETLIFDAAVDYISADPIGQAVALLGTIDAVLVAYGTLPSNDECFKNVEMTIAEFTVNATSVIALCTRAAQYFEAQQEPSQRCIAVISSVAGDRGRQSNYVYGSSKGAVSIFLQGLRNRLYDRGIAVVTIKPGFVDSPMTAHLPKNALFASTRKVGVAIMKSMNKGRDIVYVPSFWRFIMFVVRMIPESIFKTMKL